MTKAGFNTLYREHYQRVLGLCRRMLGAMGDAEDAAQEVFLRGYKARQRYRPDDPFGAWIGAIASNYCIDQLRRRKRQADVFSEVVALVQDPASVPDPTAHGVTLLISAYEADTISKAVDTLPEQYRLPIVLAYYADASYLEIASTLNLTANHVGVLLMRARQRLREELASLDA